MPSAKEEVQSLIVRFEKLETVNREQSKSIRKLVNQNNQLQEELVEINSVHTKELETLMQLLNDTTNMMTIEQTIREIEIILLKSQLDTF